MARRLDGRRIALEIRAEVAEGVSSLISAGHAPPCLTAILVGEDPASVVYVRNKMKACAEAGIIARQERLSSTTSQESLLETIRGLVDAGTVDGILVQMPLPGGMDRRVILDAVDPAKDVDGFHPVNVGRLWAGQDGFVPCTPLGVIELLERERIPIEGKEAVIIGRSEIVGKPMAALLMARNATVTVCHSRTKDLAGVASRADILVAAIGRPAMVTKDFIKPGATVIDVGINRVDDPGTAARLFGEDSPRVARVKEGHATLVGDAHPADVENAAGAYTPVPGGIGPLTIALLLKNTLRAARLRRVSS